VDLFTTILAALLANQYRHVVPCLSDSLEALAET
jgi:hypothetical protein